MAGFYMKHNTLGWMKWVNLKPATAQKMKKFLMENFIFLWSASGPKYNFTYVVLMIVLYE